jgi:hypothetical protein
MPRRNPYEDRPGGRRYRGQLERIERKVTIFGILILILVVCLIVFAINKIR